MRCTSKSIDKAARELHDLLEKINEFIEDREEVKQNAEDREDVDAADRYESQLVILESIRDSLEEAESAFNDYES